MYSDPLLGLATCADLCTWGGGKKETVVQEVATRYRVKRVVEGKGTGPCVQTMGRHCGYIPE